MPDTNPKRRWFHLTPDRYVIGLLVVEALLWLSERSQWLPWHKGYALLTTVAMVMVAMVFMLLWFAVALIFHWRFQFSIRSLLVLVVVVAVPFSWLAVEMKKSRREREAVEALEKLGAEVSYDYQLKKNVEPSGPGWLRGLLGLEQANAEGVRGRFSAAG